MRVPRRQVLTAVPLAATAAALGLGACAPASSTSAGSSTAGTAPAAPQDSQVTGTVRVHVGGDTNVRDMWTGIIAPAVTEKFPQAHLDIQHDLHSERGQQVLARLTAAGGKDPGIDLIDDGLVIDAAASKLLAPLNSTNVPALAHVPRKLLTEGQGQAFPYRASSVLLAYDPQKVPSPPRSLSELLDWIRANPGKFAYNSPSTGGSGAAFVTSVLDMNMPAAARTKLEEGSDAADEKVWDKGFGVLRSLGPSMYQGGVYPNGNDQVIDLLVSGQIQMAPVWSDQFISGQTSGKIPARIRITQVKNPPFTGGASFLGIPQHTPAMPAALAVSQLILSAPVQTRISEQMAGYPVIGLDSMPQKIRDRFRDADPATLRPGYSTDHSKSVNEQWDQKVPTSR